VLLPPFTAAITPVDADGDGNIDLVFISCGGSNSGGGARCAVVILFNSLQPVCSSGSSGDGCRRVCSVDTFDDGSFTPPPLPLPPGDVVTQHYSVKWLPVAVAVGGSGSAWAAYAPPTVCRTAFTQPHLRGSTPPPPPPPLPPCARCAVPTFSSTAAFRFSSGFPAPTPAHYTFPFRSPRLIARSRPSGLPLLDGGMFTLLMRALPCDPDVCAQDAVAR
jgi:hypothetical protein